MVPAKELGIRSRKNKGLLLLSALILRRWKNFQKFSGNMAMKHPFERHVGKIFLQPSQLKSDRMRVFRFKLRGCTETD